MSFDKDLEIQTIMQKRIVIVNDLVNILFQMFSKLCFFLDCLTLPMLRLLSSKAQGRKDF